MSTQHTPGPWYVDSSPNAANLFCVCADTIKSEIQQGDSYYTHLESIAFFPAIVTPAIPGKSPSTYHIDDRTMANARLIAASPFLLAACERILTLLQGIDRENVTGFRMNEPISNLEQAIRKATGEA